MAFNKDLPGCHKLKNRQHEMFCKYYSQSLNGTESAKKAGFGKTYNSSADAAYRLHKRAEIAERIGYLLDRRAEKSERITDKIEAQLMGIAEGNIMDFINFNKRGSDFNFNVEAMKEKGGAIQEITIQAGKNSKKTIKLNDKMKAIELLVRIFNDVDKARFSIDTERHVSDMLAKGNVDDIKVEDDGFIEAMNDIADNTENDEFVITEGKDDLPHTEV